MTHSRHWPASKAAGMRHDTVYGILPFLLGLGTSSEGIEQWVCCVLASSLLHLTS